MISIKNKIIIYRNTVIANCKNNKQFSYSIRKYGDCAMDLAKLSIKYNRRFNNLIKCKKRYAILYIYNRPLNKIFEVKIDHDEIEKVLEYKWYIKTKGNSRTFYAYNDKVGSMHRFILNLNDRKKIVDHINRNGLDNRKINLRITNNSINKKNMNPTKNNKFNHNGISFDGVNYVVHWSENGKFKTKKFSSNKYKNALKLALIYRLKKEKENEYL